VRSFVATILLLVAGCATAPTSPSQPVFIKGPLQGHFESGAFRDKRDWFEVKAPLPPGDPDYGSMRVNEEYVANASNVGFILTKSPGEFYDAYVEDFYWANHPVPSMGQVADSAMKVFGTEMVKQRIEPLRLVEERPWHVGKTTGLLRLYTERTPTELLMLNLGMAEDYTDYILMYVTAQHGKVAMLWMEWPMDCKVCIPLLPGTATTSVDPIDRALAANGRSGLFMDSFRYDVD